MAWPRAAALVIVIFGLMILEAWRAARNERRQRARGGIEPEGDVYAWMSVAYPASFILMLTEGMLRGDAPPPLFFAGAIVFALAKALKWWAIVTLGPFWTFRVIVVPGTTRIDRGPYRLMAHPNYAGVAGELAGCALMTFAVISGPAATVVFVWLMWRRVRIERRALDAILRL
jgi:methyltransferase